MTYDYWGASLRIGLNTLTRTLEWWKHLKWRKRDQAKGERRAAKAAFRSRSSLAPQLRHVQV